MIMKHLLKVSPLFVCAVVAVIAVSLMANPAAFDQVKGGATYKCTACLPAGQCNGPSQTCSDMGFCVFSCDDARSYSGASQCQGTATSDCSNGSVVDCAWDTVCWCTSVLNWFTCQSFRGPFAVASVVPC
jgi:hypothetical protein